jgi:hypothetical protein
LKHNKIVCKNREVLRGLIDVTCHLVNQALPFSGHDESYSSLNRGNYIELVQLLRQDDTVLKDHIETATLFNATSSAIQNDSIQSIHDVLLDEITIQILMLHLFLLCWMRLQMLKEFHSYLQY